ncbi:MAG: metallophosphoesterase [Clostridia bacterium]|nr:metallophosphoesterase [Clostridia bacterium]
MSRIISIILSLIMLLPPVAFSENEEEYEKMTSFKESLYVLFNKKNVAGEYHTGKVSDEIFDENAEFTSDMMQTIVKEKGKDFKILTLADIHYADYGYRIFTSFFNTAKIKNLVKKTNPDLIILTGDNVCGDDGNSDYYSIQRITDMMESFGVPWAPVFGNHDDESNCDLNFIADVMMQSPHCLFKKGDSRMGIGNYIINVAEKDENGNLKTVECIFMMDSHHSQPNDLQQKWYKWATDGIRRLTGDNVEFSLFMHIPLPEYQYFYEEAWNTETKSWNDGYDAYGRLYEPVSCECDADEVPVQRGFFDIIKASGAKYVFCGHDHRNDFSGVYEGVRLTYLMKLGLSSGFQFFYDGGSVITVSDNGISRITHILSILGMKIKLVDFATK